MKQTHFLQHAGCTRCGKQNPSGVFPDGCSSCPKIETGIESFALAGKKILLALLLVPAFIFVSGQNSFREKNLIYHDEKIDLIESYLNLCLLVDSTIDKAAYYKEVNIMCREVEKTIEGYKTPHELVEKLNNYLFVTKGFKYDPYANKYLFGTKAEKAEVIKLEINERDFILLPSVLKRREGICSSLSMLFLVIAYQLQLPIYAVIVPRHEFVRYDDGTTSFNIETTDDGKEYSDDYYRINIVGKNKGSIYLKNLDNAQAIGIFSSDIGNVLMEEKRYSQAVKFFSLSIEINPALALAYESRGNAKSDLYDYCGAIEDYNKAIDINPMYAEAYDNRGLAKINLHDYAGAIEDCNKAIDINPSYARAYSNRGNAKYVLHDYAGAIEDCNKAIEISPKDAEVYYNRGNTKRYLHDYNGAIEDYNTAIEIKPEDAEANYIRGVVKAYLHDYAGAIEDYSKAIEINPGYIDAYYNRGNAKYSLQNYNDAIKDWDKAIEINPKYSKAYNNRGLVKFKLGDYAGAIVDYDKALEIDPDYSRASQNKAEAVAKQKEEK